MKRRVVVTGLGTVNPIGNNIKDFWNNLINGKSGVKKIERFSVEGLTSKVAGQISGIELEDIFDKKELRRLSDFICYGLISAEEAIKDSGIEFNNIDPYRVGVITGSGIGGLDVIQNETKNLFDNGPERVSPFLVVRMIPDMLPGRISMKFGLKGPNYSISTACASSAHSIIQAYNEILLGNADVVITGGSEAPLTEIALAGFCSLQALSKSYNETPEKASRPFELGRDGFVISEAAATLVLEDYDHAKKRGAKIYAEICGTGNTADAFHDTAPAPRGEGGRVAMELAIKSAGISKEEIDYINAHGTSTKYNDLNETFAIKDLFGDYAYKVPISSTKSMIGHTLGAAGALEACATILSIKNGIVHPTINYENPDPELDLDYVPNIAREHKVKYALSNSFGFGGHNGVLLIGRFE